MQQVGVSLICYKHTTDHQRGFTWPSVATAIANIFQKHGISIGRNLAKILNIFVKIDEAKAKGLFKGPSQLMS